MKKTDCGIICLLLSFTLFTAGCSGPARNTSSSESESAESGKITDHETAADTSFETGTDSSQTTKPPQADSVRFPGNAAPDHCMLDLTELDAESTNGLYRLDFIRQSNHWSRNLELHDNLLLNAEIVEPSNGEYEDGGEIYSMLTLYDLAEKKLIAEKKLDTPYCCGFLENGMIFCVGTAYISDVLRVSILDQSLNPVYSNTISADGTFCNYAQFSADGRYLIYRFDQEAALYIMQIETGNVRKIETDDAYTNAGGAFGKTVYLNQYSTSFSLLRLDPETAEIEKFKLPDDVFPQCRNGMAAWTDGSLLFAASAESPDLLSVIHADESSAVFDCRAGKVACVSNTYDNELATCFVYDIEKNSVYSVSLAGMDTANSIVLSDQGYAVIQLNDWFGEFHYLLWDYLAANSNPTEVLTVSESGMEPLIADTAERIKKKTDIEIFYGSQGNDFNASDYVSKAITNPFVIYCALRETEAFFGLLPDGMTKELRTKNSDGIRLYLCGKLYRTESTGIDTAIALTFSEGNFRSIAVDISQDNIKQNLSHELFHIVEDRLIEVSHETDIDLLAEWDKLSPPGFSYAYSYNDEYGNQISDTQYTVQGNEPEDNIWFVDAYAKSFPTEDRARVFENLFMANTDMMRGEHLLKKARYLCAMLRFVFPSVEKAESLHWEMLTGAPDPNEFSDIFSNTVSD